MDSPDCPFRSDHDTLEQLRDQILQLNAILPRLIKFIEGNGKPAAEIRLDRLEQAANRKWSPREWLMLVSAGAGWVALVIKLLQHSPQ